MLTLYEGGFTPVAHSEIIKNILLKNDNNYLQKVTFYAKKHPDSSYRGAGFC